jgi:hypothetical protein
MKKEDALQVCESVIAKIRYRWVGATNQDIHQFYSSIEGRVFSFWQSIRSCGVSYERARDMYFIEADKDEEWERKIKTAIELATGEFDTCRLYQIRGLGRVEPSLEDSYLVSRADLFSSLFKEPFGYTPDQVSNMTLGQISLILADHSDGREDIVQELNLATRDQSPGIRKVRSTYRRAYKEMALNLVEGRSLMSGLKS